MKKSCGLDEVVYTRTCKVAVCRKSRINKNEALLKYFQLQCQKHSRKLHGMRSFVEGYYDPASVCPFSHPAESVLILMAHFF